MSKQRNGVRAAGYIVALLVGFVAYPAVRALLKNEPVPPSRPTNVPPSAVWAGGADGGQWIACLRADDLRFRCEIFADVTGERIESGTYTLASASGSGLPLVPQLFVEEGSIQVRAWLVRE